MRTEFEEEDGGCIECWQEDVKRGGLWEGIWGFREKGESEKERACSERDRCMREKVSETPKGSRRVSGRRVERRGRRRFHWRREGAAGIAHTVG